MWLERRSGITVDWVTLGLTLAILSLSVVLLYSATYDRPGSLTGLHLKQISWVGVGLCGMAVLLCWDYQLLSRYAYVFYGVMIVSLVGVLLFGRVVNGAQRWLTIGSLSFQTSELAKPIVILALARYLTTDIPRDATPLTLRYLLLPSVLVGLPCWLIMKQPDLSTAMVLLGIACVMMLMVGIQGKTLAIVAGLGICSLPIVWHLLKGYQRDRLVALLNPQSDLLGMGYHGWQSKIAVGSGALWGKGLFAGTQSRLSFLPEKHTDFIFAVLAEEGGFVGVLLLVSLLSLLILHGLTTASRSRDDLGALLAVGVATMLAVQVCLNIGMTIGLLPIIGLPLPLVSYGGSSLVVTFLCLGLMMNVRMRRVKSSTFSS